VTSHPASWIVSNAITNLALDIFVRDLDSAVEERTKRYGLAPWKRSSLVVRDPVFRGQPTELSFDAAVFDLGPLTIELLEADGDPAVVEWFEGEGDGSSWFPAIYFEDLERAVAGKQQFTRFGFEPVFEGRIAGSTYWVYDTTDLLGCRFEIAGGDLSEISFDTAHR
jgi:hypothetical protein